MRELEIALKAVQLYAEMKPRPVHVTQTQAAEMLGMSRQTVSKLIRAGTLKLNKCGLIPIIEIDHALHINMKLPSSSKNSSPKIYKY